MRILLLGYLLFNVISVNAQHPKFDGKLSDYDISLQPDAKWRRITFAEVKVLYEAINIDITAILNERPFVTMFGYIPVDSSVKMIMTTEITIEVFRIKDSTREASLPRTKDTIQTNKPFLMKMNERIYYYDPGTQSYLVRFKTELRGKGIDRDNPPKLYAIEQTKRVGDYIVVARYHATAGQESAYFDSFEKMISSFK